MTPIPNNTLSNMAINWSLESVTPQGHSGHILCAPQALPLCLPVILTEFPSALPLLIYCSDPSIFSVSFWFHFPTNFHLFVFFSLVVLCCFKWHYGNLDNNAAGETSLTCVEKHDKLFYVFWHGRNGHLKCERQQTSEPSGLQKKKLKLE